MKKLYFLIVLAIASFAANAQFKFPIEATANFQATSVVLPQSPLKSQILFIGGVDSVQTVGSNGQANGFQLAKEWHDFIGFTPDTAAGTQDLGWLSINHEQIWKDDKVGDGGGMTAFKIRRNSDGSIGIVNQVLPDGRTGKFFNVDFKNTVGETGMNCSGISAPDGRIWTAEEWFRTNNQSIWVGDNQPYVGSAPGNGVRDTADWTISTTIPGDFNGKTIKKYQNFNYMVEINPRTAKAIRKQYNWGRGGWEGGIVMPDNKTVYLGIDESPGPWVKFVANTAGDFTTGNLYAWKSDGTWVQLVNDKFDSIANLSTNAFAKGAAIFNRNEWVAYGADGKVYWTETGRDAFNFSATVAGGATMSPHWAKAYKTRNPSFTGTDAAAIDSVMNGKFADYYGRVLVYDPATSKVDIYLEGGPFQATSLPVAGGYPAKHLSNPDGLGTTVINGRPFMFILEDLNGRSFGRTPAENQAAGGEICELWMLDMTIKNPTINDLVRIAATPKGAEVTGVIASPDGKTLFLNSQHPAATHPFPFNHSLTMAITGWENIVNTFVGVEEVKNADVFSIYPNPVSRELNLNTVSDIAIYDFNGKRLKVLRNVEVVDVSDLAAGTYIIMNDKGQTQKLVVE